MLRYLQPVSLAAYDDFIERQRPDRDSSKHGAMMEVTARGIQMNTTGDSDTTETLQPAALRFGQSFQEEKGTLFVVFEDFAEAEEQVIANDISLL